MAYIFNVLGLGNLGVTLDPTEGNATAESASQLVGRSFSFTGQDLQRFSPLPSSDPRYTFHETYDSTGYNDTYNQDNSYGTDWFRIAHPDGTTTYHAFDTIVLYNAIVIYADGSSRTGQVLIGQSTDGQAWVFPPSIYTPGAILDGHISSIKVTGVPSGGATSSGLYYDRADMPNLVVCFAAGTLIETSQGQRPIETLVVGDLIATRDSGFQPIRWINARTLASADLTASPHLRPIRISAGALGRGLLSSDLLVSPQHRILVRSAISRRMFSTGEVLVAARQLCGVDGIDQDDGIASVTYHHFLFDTHEIVFSNGVETESLFPGPQALKTVGPKALVELFELFPELVTGKRSYVPARPLTSGRMARKLAIRHQHNGKPLVETAQASVS